MGSDELGSVQLGFKWTGSNESGSNAPSPYKIALQLIRTLGNKTFLFLEVHKKWRIFSIQLTFPRNIFIGNAFLLMTILLAFFVHCLLINIPRTTFFP